MNKPFYGWVMVALGALMTCVAVGAMFSLAVFLQPIQQATGWSRAGVSAAMTLNFLTMGLGGFLWGTLSDRYGPRPVVLAGSVLLGIGLAAASRATSLLEFQLAYGVLVGFAAGSFFAPMIASVANWFDKHRSLAVSLVSVGVGVAPMTISPFAAWLIQQYDWRTSQLVIAILAWGLLIPAAVFVRTAPVQKSSESTNQENSSLSLLQALRSTPFIVLALTFFACCAAHSGPIFHTISYAILCGIPTTLAVTIYSVEGLAGLGGRPAVGVAGRPHRREAGADRRLGHPGARRRHLLHDFSARRVLCGGGAVRLRLRRRYAALRSARARVLRAEDHGRCARRGEPGLECRHGARAVGRWRDFRPLRRLRLALHRLVRDGRRSGGHRIRLPPVYATNRKETRTWLARFRLECIPSPRPSSAPAQRRRSSSTRRRSAPPRKCACPDPMAG